MWAQKIRQQTDWGKCYYFSFQCIVSRCPNCPKEEWEWGTRGIKRGGYIRINVCKPACVWVLVNTNACGHTHAGLQICRQAIRKRAGSNIMWKRYGIKSRTVLLIFISKMCNKCTIMIRCWIFSFFREITLAMKEKNTTFANEKSVLLINAKHCRIEKFAGFKIVTC